MAVPAIDRGRAGESLAHSAYPLDITSALSAADWRLDTTADREPGRAVVRGHRRCGTVATTVATTVAPQTRAFRNVGPLAILLKILKLRAGALCERPRGNLGPMWAS